MRIGIALRALEIGGAEVQSVALARGLARRGHDVGLVTLYGGGPLEDAAAESGVPVDCLAKRGRYDLARPAARYADWVRRVRPDVVYGLLSAGHVLAALARAISPSTRAVWGVRSSDMDWSAYGAWDELAFQAGRRLAPTADLVIANSEAGRRHLLRAGFPAERTVVIPNGIDIERFRPDPDARARLRRAWEIPAGAPWIGMVARIDPMKDHATFLDAAAEMRRSRPDARFAVVGSGPAERERRVRERARLLGIDGAIAWIPRIDDPESVYPAFDIVTLTSAWGEGFPNVLAEAMACGVPCVATDCGDAARIVGDPDAIVPRGDAAGLARAWARILDRNRGERAAELRGGIAERFSLAVMVAETERALSRAVPR